MKRTFITFCLSAAMVLALAGCAGNGTADGQLPANSASPSTTPDITGNGTDDLAGADGIVGDDDAGLPDAGSTNGTGTDGATDGENGAAGRSRSSAMDGVGRGIMDSMEDLGEGARDALDDMGRGARSAMDDMGTAARKAGQHVRQSIN